MAKKKVALTDEARAFLLTLEDDVHEQFTMICRKLEEYGYLVAPYGEKVAGQDGLFVIRILTGNNVRFFYCYIDKSVEVWALSGYEKRSRKIPGDEVKRALNIMKSLGGKQ